MASDGLNTASGGHFGFVPGGGLSSGAVAAWIGSTVNPFVGSAGASTGAVAIEAVAVRWLRDMLGLPSELCGILTSGGSMAALTAMLVAREARPELDLRQCCVYASEQAHFSFERAARLSGVARSNVRRVRCTPLGTLDVAHLQQLLVQDRARSLVPFVLCASAGTASLGAVDPLRELSELARQQEMWFHVDAAYGGGFASLPENTQLFDGMGQADSVVVDPHKSLFASYGLGALFVRDRERLRRAFALQSDEQSSSELPDYFQLGPELSRDFRGLRVWLPLALHGAEAFRVALRARGDWARELWRRLARLDQVEVGPAPQLSVVAFRVRPVGLSPEQVDGVNQALLESINASQRVFVTGARLAQGYFLRVCVLHLRTDEPRVDELHDTIVAQIAALRAWLAERATA
jgi:aromatic-L-amino-acid decarboxylase